MTAIFWVQSIDIDDRIDIACKVILKWIYIYARKMMHSYENSGKTI